jgi:hypothetical protein
VIVAPDRRLFRGKRKKPCHFTLGAVFKPLGPGPQPLIVVPTFSGTKPYSWGRMSFRAGPAPAGGTDPIFAAFADHVCDWMIADGGRYVAPSRYTEAAPLDVALHSALH